MPLIETDRRFAISGVFPTQGKERDQLAETLRAQGYEVIQIEEPSFMGPLYTIKKDGEPIGNIMSNEIRVKTSRNGGRKLCEHLSRLETQEQ